MQDTQIIGNKKRTSESLQKIPSTKTGTESSVKRKWIWGSRRRYTNG